MSQPPDRERPAAQERHPEVFHDRDAGQVFPEDGRSPEPAVVTGLKKGCLWAIAFAAVVLLILAVAWNWAWREAPPELMDPPERPRPGAEAGPPGLMEDQVIGERADEADGRQR